MRRVLHLCSMGARCYAGAMGDSTEVKTVRDFLERSPLFLAVHVDLGSACQPEQLPVSTSLDLDCTSCKRSRTFNLSVPNLLGNFVSIEALPEFGGGFLATYACTDCGKGQESFWIGAQAAGIEERITGRTLMNGGISRGTPSKWASKFTLRKFGQSTVPLPHSAKALQKLLGDDLGLYRRALQCMSMGFGIGAVAYLRRVVENKTMALLDQLQRVLVAEEDTEGLAKLEKARGSHSSQQRLELAAELLPNSLRLGRHNPLAVMFGAFSAELHGSVSDEEAHATAVRLQHALDFLVTRIEEHLSEMATFGTVIAGETNKQ